MGFTNTLTKKSNGELMTPTEYYDKYLNFGDYKSKYVYKKEKCKDKCEGPNSGLTDANGTVGYDKWLGSNDDTPNDAKEYGNVETGCVAANIVLPLYQQGIPAPGSSCNDCNGNPVKLFDSCIDGAFGPDSKTKCKKASKVDFGNVATGEVTARKKINLIKNLEQLRMLFLELLVELDFILILIQQILTIKLVRLKTVHGIIKLLK